MHIYASVGQPHQTHRQVKGWPWYHYLTLSINDHFTIHITYSDCEDPDKSQNPTPPISPVGELNDSFTTQGNSWHPGTTGHKGKENWTQPAKRSPGRPVSGKVVKLWLECCSTITEDEKHTKSHTGTCQNTFSIITHLCLTLSVAGRQAPTTISFQGKARGFLTLPKVIQSEGQSGPHRYTGLSQRSYST